MKNKVKGGAGRSRGHRYPGEFKLKVARLHVDESVPSPV